MTASAVFAHSAHRHGVAHVDLVQEQGAVELDLQIDGESLVGFERAPVSVDEQVRFENARIALADGASLFEFPATAECQWLAGEVRVPHGPDSGKPDEQRSGHSDWQASYRFHCQNLHALSGIDFTAMFVAFPGISVIQIQLITDTGQSSAELRPGQSRLSW
jgi:hypothetical protein